MPPKPGSEVSEFHAPQRPGSRLECTIFGMTKVKEPSQNGQRFHLFYTTTLQRDWLGRVVLP